MKHLSHFLLALGWIAFSGHAIGSPEILTIYSTTPLGVVQGTGFFVSKNGVFVTAYHVVRNARQINAYVEQDNRMIGLTNITIFALDPGHDLAVLQALDARKVKFLPVRELDSISDKDDLEVRGHPRGMVEQVFRAAVTRTEPVKSTGIFGALGRPIFREEIDVFLVESIAYGGLSGAPVLKEGQVVGVLSGSLDEQRSVTWAIPAKHILALLSAEPSNTRLRDQKQWPDFSLMANNWRSLTRGLVRNDEAFELVLAQTKRIAQFRQAVEQAGMNAYAAEQIDISVRSALLVAQTELGASDNKKVEIVNLLLQQNRVNGSHAVKALKAVETVYTIRQQLAEDTLKIQEWVAHSALPEKVRNQFSTALQKLKLRHPLELETDPAPRRTELDEALAAAERIISAHGEVKFSSWDEVQEFSTACAAARSMSSEYRQQWGIQRALEEMQAFTAVSALAQRHLQYLMFLDELP